MRFVSFNIRYDNPADGPDAWPHRASAVAGLLAARAPDVFGLQEALRNQIDDVQRALGDAYEKVGVGREGGGEGEQNPIFFRADLTLRDGGTFWLSDTPAQPGSRFAGSAFPRICTWVRLQRGEGKPFYFFNTHFDYQSEAVQKQSAELLLTQIPKIAGLYPSVLVGDLNCTPSSVVRRRLATSFFQDTSDLAARLPPDRRPNAAAGTFTGFRDAGRAAEVLPGGETIDYVFLSGFALERREVCLDVRPDGRCISDHRALIIDARMSV